MMYSNDDDTIVAQCTARGNGAIALIRLSGTQALTIAERISQLASGKLLDQVASHTVHFGLVTDVLGVAIDQVMFTVMRGPKTFTGQDTVEITCHNNHFIIESILSLLILHGARAAGPGEFTARAFTNGKIDLLQAEAVNELIHAQTQSALKRSLSQLQGTFSHWLCVIEDRLVRTLAWCEASFEFLDEEIEFGQNIAVEIEALSSDIKKAKKVYDIRQQIREGIRIALIGTVNAGKSSLFNLLLGKNRSIVTDIPGTTRDSVEAGLYKKDYFWTLIDTAGLRDSEDRVEQEGIIRSQEEAHKADIILIVYDCSRPVSGEELVIYEKLLADYAHKAIIVHNKVDLSSTSLAIETNKNQLISAVNVSGLTGHNIDILEQLIHKKIDDLLESNQTPFLLNERQYNILLGLETKLVTIVTMLRQSIIQYELVSLHLREALEHLTELTGKSVSENALDRVFKEFCVGK